jgi:hypothetical protein
MFFGRPYFDCFIFYLILNRLAIQCNSPPPLALLSTLLLLSSTSPNSHSTSPPSRQKIRRWPDVAPPWRCSALSQYRVVVPPPPGAYFMWYWDVHGPPRFSKIYLSLTKALPHFMPCGWPTSIWFPTGQICIKKL